MIRLIQKIGIFMIAAQAVIHFAPGIKYEKYIKLIVGILILLQFLSPVYGVMEHAEKEWKEQLFLIEQKLETDGWSDAKESSVGGYGAVSQIATKRLEEEIKSKLNKEIAEEDYFVASVIVVMRETAEQDETGVTQYELGRVRVTVQALNAQGEAKGEISSFSKVDSAVTTPVEPVRIDKIDEINVGTDTARAAKMESGEEGDEAAGIEEEETMDGEEQEAEEVYRLQKCFCKALGIERERVEVAIYGAGEKDSQ